MYEKLKERVFSANLELVKHGLVIFTWGNVSEIDDERKIVAIKPSGVSYQDMKSEDITIIDLSGRVLEGHLKPSSDTPTHLELYKAFLGVKGITHTHSTYATSFAQSGRDIPCYGTTHADYFYGDIPCARALTKLEVEGEYESNTGHVIIERFKGLDAMSVPAVLVKNHGTFSFGNSALDAVHNAVCCEQVAKMAYLTESLSSNVKTADKYLLDKHYFRKHGANAYYGQNKK